MKTAMIKLILALTIVTLFAFNKDEDSENAPVTYTTLNGVNISNFMYQIQQLGERSSIDLLDDTEYDMLVVEPGFNLSDSPYDVAYMVNKLKTKPNGDNRILLAYIDIGQAEEWRTYWGNDWIAPTETAKGYPDFLVTVDPDGWEGNYPVAYWDADWQSIWLGNNGLIKKIADFGFDGVYLDWVEAYDDDSIRNYAATQDKNPENEMMKFIEKIRNKGKTVKADFLVVSQNAPYLIDADPDYYSTIIDAIATEDTWFYGAGDADWDSPDAGDLKGGERHEGYYSTPNRIAQNKKYLNYGIPVFTVDYCISSDNAEFVYNESRKNGFIPLVTRVSLSKLTETPPF
ncbi:MAG: glycoside hydrolase, end-alpha-1,4-polygalactosaminidase [Gammaproteobacteria bacterium]|nr:MAG: glycoside hydrolase, end-alpha-1,4-polygalactosaminidase [Gammaproteobacteria bacterium]